MRATPLLLAAFVGLGAKTWGCKSPTAPTPTPTPQPSPPYSLGQLGKPNSTLLENVPLIRILEQGMRTATVLVALRGAASQDGLIRYSWGYEFGEIKDGVVKLYTWVVLANGEIRYNGETSDHDRLTIREMEPSFTLDSPALVRLAREYGGQPYVDRFPNAYAGMFCHFAFGDPICEIRFESPGAPCRHGPFHIHTATGELMARQLACLNLLGAR